ncbi:putative metal tolerance protein [Clavispora lusitaniae]|uniref:Cation efflux protein transmembrane domain-containing protein n=3 Tax=Clavispora lusitaniae TaxID=36911 RepID=C4XYX0_CLAL4|nr:uncharacterized protein CLUG_01143 [Clavispora lusitaniae ATCC 42720]KAF5212551.1 hypothetical protein E0198_000044 [Clavispora lusitaniae]EEQ37020.1 hypothetical protein CLUG_01143 [Clavispora lusitaniae ATCC 42720]KAF7585009.1 Cation efflux family protein [Clavispora lusitaniae]OVF08264.1 putative cation diffusion facilitator family transporter [Clavispora lusitaniae]QFZ26046.1 putative metal tolerance protein [Clavispora lusitaniae]
MSESDSYSFQRQSKEHPKRSESQPLLDGLDKIGQYYGNQNQNQNARPGRQSSISALDLLRNEPPPQQNSRPFLQTILSGGYTVSNPNSSSLDVNQYAFQDGASMASMDLESNSGWSSHRRLNILSVLRPEKLIGKFIPLTNWSDKIKKNPERIRNKGLREFYQEQNVLLLRYQEIDRLLDYGKIHLNMLSTYKDSGNSISNTTGCDEGMSNNLLGSTEMEQSLSKSRFNDLPGNINEGGQFLGYNKEESSQEIRVAILVNFFINFLLLIGKTLISFMTSSLSVVASLVDSVLDFLSTFIIYIANKLSETNNWRTKFTYPIGRKKLEPLGILIFSVIIIISFFQVGLESAKRLLLSTRETRVAVKVGREATAVMISTIVAKIACWWWCSLNKSSSVQALAQDAMTDIIFNSVSLVVPTLGYYLDTWWLDPAGALSLSLYVIVSWSITAFEHVDNLTGTSADPLDYKVVLYLAYRFAECIKQITSLKVYHVGDNVNVEIDLVFNTDDYDLSFKDAHDIAEALQYAIETLPMVERAFVHIDYMEGNFKGHLN